MFLTSTTYLSGSNSVILNRSFMITINLISWITAPVIFRIPEITFPFPISFSALFLAVILYYFGYQHFKPEPASRKEKAELPALTFWGLLIGSFIVGQLPFLLIGSPEISTLGPIDPRWYGLMFACAFI